VEPIIDNSNVSSTDIYLTTQLNGASSNGLNNGIHQNGEISTSNHNRNRITNQLSEEKLISCKAEWVRLNIGGQYFVTTKTTLCKNPHSFFYKLCQDDPTIGLTTYKDETGAFLIDRDPQYFAPILNYLRHGKLIIEKNLREEGVLEEAEFYNIHELIHLVKERIKERDLAQTSAVSLFHFQVSSFSS
jgi:hypothetical protein